MTVDRSMVIRCVFLFVAGFLAGMFGLKVWETAVVAAVIVAGYAIAELWEDA